MHKNLGSTDRIIRLILGVFLLSMLFWVEGGLKYAGFAGIILIATAAVDFCPVYALLGISTKEKKPAIK